ncbi:trypsin-like serine protease [Streptococcus mitis]|nr:trypsin-like serine protease [Streptococcus mitis]MQQ12916.1 trypsin-like serine protease [Streptococcus mitis]MQQ43916.1 trypsin-like serine protease [Streptococcus mitis]MQQ47490.1 trypsin-like serine protease [Streptococcus mitis]MQQ56997.1 trypsin-like serine protease [Streptococcus mitis]
MFICLKGLGKFRKSKAYGLVGCLTLSAVIGLAAPELPVIGGGVVYADVIQGGSDIHDVDVHSKSAEGVAMTYTTYDSGTSGKQTASGSGVFVAPNVMVTVAHNYYDKNQEDKSAVLRGGESARSYVVMNSEKEKSNKVPTSGVSEALEKDSIHLYNGKDFGKDYSNDLAVVVTKKPVEAMTGGEDSPRELSHKEVSTGDKITMVGYPNDFSTPNLSKENKARLKDGKAYSVSTTVGSINKESGAVTYHSSALGGFSGAPLFNDKGEVVGIHQHGTNTSNAPESERIGGGTIFTEKHRAWIQSMIDKYGIKGWYIDGANRYYYDENHIALKDVESEIDGALYSFDEKGRATLVKGEEKGRVLLRVEDTKGTRLISDKVVQEGPVGSGLNFHLRQNPDFKQLIATSPTAKVVSYNGVPINKLASDTSWPDEYVSKLALGDTIIRAVVDSATPPSTSSSDFARTEVGKVDLSGKSNLPVPSKEVLQAPNGSENFYATTHIQTPDGSGSGTLIAPNLVLTVAHNFLTVKGSEVITKSGRTNTVYKATLPNGLSVNFSDDDIVYWNKKDSVFGFKNDLALVRLKEEVKGSTPVEVVKQSSKVAEGDSVSVYGFPDNKLSPVLDSKVVGITDFGSGIEGISYGGTKPGASGGGLYNDKGALIGVHQNGVVGSRSGGLVLSKEQLDWVRSYIEGQPKDPVYVEDKEVEPSKKDSDKDLAGKLDPKKDSEKEDSGILGTSGDFVAPTVAKPEFKGGVPFTESPILEIPEYMGVLSTSGEESAPTVEQHDFTGGVNGGDSLVTEVPEYSGVLSTLGDSPAPTVAKPEFKGGVNGGDSLVTEVPEYSGIISTLGDSPAPTVAKPEFTGGVNGGDSLVTEVPEYSGVLSTLGDSPAPTVAKPEFTGGVNGGDSLVTEVPEYRGFLSTLGNSPAPTVVKPEFTGGVNGGDSLVTEVPEYSGIISTLGDSPAPTVAKPEYMGDTLSSSGEESTPTVEQHDFTGGVNGGDSLVTEVPEYSGVLSTLGDFPAPTVAKPEFKGGVNGGESPILEIPEYMGPLSTSGEGSSVVKSTDKQVNNKNTKDESETKHVVSGIASSQRILKNETGSIQIQASEEVLKNVIGIQMQEVQVSDFSSLNYKAFDIKLKDVNGRYVKPEGKVLVTFAIDQSVENVYAVDPEGKLHTIEFEQKDGKIIFETNNSSIYAMTFRHSIDNPLFKNPTEDNKAEEVSLSPKLLSTNENSESNRLENKVSNNEQSMLPNTGESASSLTILFGFVGVFLGAMISYKRKDS